MKYSLNGFTLLILMACTSFTHADTRFETIPAGTCQAIFLNETLAQELKWEGDGSIENFRGDRDVWVVCPITLTNPEGNGLIVGIELFNSNSYSIDFFCSLKEVARMEVLQAQNVSDSLPPTTQLTGDGFLLSLELSATEPSTTALTCKIPSGGALGAIFVVQFE